MPEIKAIVWLFYDITMLGVGGYTFANTFAENVNVVEKILLFIASMIFFIYRITILHEDRRKKKIENDHADIDLDERRKKLKRMK